MLGRLGSRFRGQSGVRVTVNGVVATITGDRYEAELPLRSGSNDIVVEVTAAALRERRVTAVTHRAVSPNNVISTGSGTKTRIVATLGSAGLAIVDPASRASRILTPPAGVDGFHDVSAADGLLFALDATRPGNLVVYDFRNPAAPQQLGPARSVAVSPFAGVSAAGGRVVVSGGTSLLSVHDYDARGLGTSTGTIDLGIGQPDVTISADGREAYVSTDFASPRPGGQRFGVTILDISNTTRPSVRARLGMAGAGFSGSTGPANFAIESALVRGLVVTAHAGGLSVLEATSARLRTTLALGFGGVNSDAQAATVAVVGGRSWTTVDFTTPSNPRVGARRSLSGGGSATGVAITPGAIFIADNGGGLRALPR